VIADAKKDVLDVLEAALQAIKSKYHAALHGLSDHVLHAMSIYQDPDITNVAVAIYALDKILETEKFQQHPKMKEFVADVIVHLKYAIKGLQKNDFKQYSRSVKELLGEIQGFTKQIRFYIEDVLHFAQIKKGSKLYEHGLSLGAAAEAMGVTKWELMEATGETVVHEKYVEPIAEDEERLRVVGKWFRVRL